MSKINVLSPDVSALIAAGEVIERPSSVIKELCENAIDAGAKNITVEIKNGGISYMRVTDDGSGMDVEDAQKALMRHATSKISGKTDLESIKTLGFRGEALYSIAAVSKTEMFTCTENGDGTRVSAEAGKISETSPAGCPKGTTITVKNLFFNTPARMKFLKKDATEAGYVEDVLRRLALAKPDISFRFINSGKEVFFTPGDNVLKNATHAVYGRDIVKSMIEASHEENGVLVKGLVGKPEISHGNRSYQTFLVNGRYVINKNLYFALQEAYKNQMMKGRFPVAVLNIYINPALCDVNVHPTKAEVKFADESSVCGAVYWAAKNALYSVSEQRSLKIPEVKNTFEAPKVTVTQSTLQDSFTAKEKTEYKKPLLEKVNIRETYPENTIKAAEPPIISMPYPVFGDDAKKEAPKKAKEQKNIKILGQLFETYIVAELDGEMLVIDQHAAHERLIYRKLLSKSGEKNVSQVLLVPEMVELSGSDFGVFLENEHFFKKYGFEAEEFGHNTVRISLVPESLVGADIKKAFCEMIEVLGSGRGKTAELEDKALYQMACRAALKAGQHLTREEQEELILKILDEEGQITCPHGRPAVLRLTKKEIEKQFKRIL